MWTHKSSSQHIYVSIVHEVILWPRLSPSIMITRRDFLVMFIVYEWQRPLLVIVNSATPPSMLAASNALLFIAFEVRRREKHFFF